MRARLAGLDTSGCFRVICEPEMVDHLHRVVLWAGGRIVELQSTGAGVILTITKDTAP